MKSGTHGLKFLTRSLICQDVLKSTNLLNKRGFDDSQSSTTVVYMLLNDILPLGNICTSPLFRNVCEISSSCSMDVDGCVQINSNLFVAPI